MASHGDPAVQSGASGDCENKGGNDYLKCQLKDDPSPISSALMNNPGFLDNMQKILGKNLGDFAKGYKGDGSSGSIAGYAASGLGLPSSIGSAIGNALEKAAQIAGGSKADTSGGGYKSASRESGAKSDDLDFNKMMEGLLKQVSPEEAGKKNQDPSEIVFRKLDLLPADKIEASKDISLFARIGFRYRKKASSVEALNPTPKSSENH
jgi:hypothetical protein